jgi:hypothetical protein
MASFEAPGVAVRTGGGEIALELPFPLVNDKPSPEAMEKARGKLVVGIS